MDNPSEVENQPESLESQAPQGSQPKAEIENIRSLLEILKVKKIDKMLPEIMEHESLCLIMLKVVPEMKTYQSLYRQFLNEMSFFKDGDFKNETKEIENIILCLEESFDNAAQEAFLSDEQMSKMSEIALRAHFINSTKILKVFIEALVLNFLKLSTALPIENKKLRKRLKEYAWKLNRKKTISIYCQNPNITWQEALELIENSDETNISQKIPDFLKIEELFRSRKEEGEVYINAKEFLEFMEISTSNSSWRIHLKFYINTLPIISLKCSDDIYLIDAELFLSNERMMTDLFEVFNNEKLDGISGNGKKLFQPDDDSMKRKVGRTPLHKKHPDWIRAVNEFSNQCGVAAHRRRGSEVGSMGFSIPQLRRFFLEKILKPNEKAPSLATLR